MLIDMESELAKGVKTLTVKVESVQEIHEILKLCDKYGYNVEAVSSTVFRLVSKDGGASQ